MTVTAVALGPEVETRVSHEKMIMRHLLLRDLVGHGSLT